MNYSRRLAFFLITVVAVAVILVIFFFVSARNTVGGMHWRVDIPHIPDMNNPS